MTGPRRYPRTDLLALAATAGDVPTHTQGTAAGQPAMPDIDVGAGRALGQEVLDALLANSAEFKRTWMHARPEHWSLSEYDLALSSIAAGGGLTEQQLADLIATHRRIYDPGGTKGARADYIQRTVGKAREQARRAGHIDWFKAAAKRAAA